MILNIYAIRDSKVNFQQLLMLNDTDPAMSRGFGFMVNNPESVMNYAPKDFDLFKVGTFDTASGKIDPIVPAEYIMNGVDCITEK